MENLILSYRIIHNFYYVKFSFFLCVCSFWTCNSACMHVQCTLFLFYPRPEPNTHMRERCVLERFISTLAFRELSELFTYHIINVCEIKNPWESCVHTRTTVFSSAFSCFFFVFSKFIFVFHLSWATKLLTEKEGCVFVAVGLFGVIFFFCFFCLLLLHICSRRACETGMSRKMVRVCIVYALCV